MKMLRSNRVSGVVVGVLLSVVVLSLLMVMQLQSAQAAYLSAVATKTPTPKPWVGSCLVKYTVASGDSLYRIASAYSVSFNDLAELNKIQAPYMLYVGQILCIPKGATIPTEFAASGTAAATNATKVAYVYSITDQVWIGVANFSKNHIYYVKVYSGRIRNYPMYQLGLMYTDKTGKSGSWYRLPSAVKSLRYITVCIKDAWNDDLEVCQYVYNNDRSSIDLLK
jgi:LysM repeat protein